MTWLIQSMDTALLPPQKNTRAWRMFAEGGNGFGQGTLRTCFIQVRWRQRRQFLIHFRSRQSNRGAAYLYPVTVIRGPWRSQALQPKRWDLCDSLKVSTASWGEINTVEIEVGSIWCQGSGVWSVWGSCPRLIWRLIQSVYLLCEHPVSFVFHSRKWLCIRNQNPVWSFALLAVFVTLYPSSSHRFESSMLWPIVTFLMLQGAQETLNLRLMELLILCFPWTHVEERNSKTSVHGLFVLLPHPTHHRIVFKLYLKSAPKHDLAFHMLCFYWL